MRRLAPLVATLLLALAGCARPVVVAPGVDDLYVRPAVRPGELSPAERRALDKAWPQILAGDAAAAEKRLVDAMRGRPVAHLDSALGWARLRLGRPEAAAADFEAAIGRRPQDVSALAGASAAAARLGRDEEAVVFLRTAAALAPEEARLARRLAGLKLAVSERLLTLATQAQAEGRSEDALGLFVRCLAAVPELASARLAAAEILLARGARAEAIELLDGEPNRERTATSRLAELLLEDRQPARALDLLRALQAREPSDEGLRAAVGHARQEVENARMPEPYRRIPAAARITRADLAALLMAKLPQLEGLEAGEPPLAVDVSGSWARPFILRALALRLMDVYPNHTFQPAAQVRKGELAQALARVLDAVGHPAGAMPVLTDMSRSHLQHAAASRAAGAGLLSITPSGAFEPWRVISGTQAVEVVEALARLLKP
ncbi:MAG: tetratricopeptide repeat protein [Vicinamibacteria bacterium]|nr:tetratricopeptide repeat protein [Vicinamibacteria bacterium]